MRTKFCKGKRNTKYVGEKRTFCYGFWAVTGSYGPDLMIVMIYVKNDLKRSRNFRPSAGFYLVCQTFSSLFGEQVFAQLRMSLRLVSWRNFFSLQEVVVVTLFITSYSKIMQKSFRFWRLAKVSAKSPDPPTSIPLPLLPVRNQLYGFWGRLAPCFLWEFFFFFFFFFEEKRENTTTRRNYDLKWWRKWTKWWTDTSLTLAFVNFCKN